MRFPDRFFRSSSDLHAFSKSILQIVFRSFFFFLRIWFFSSSNHLHLHAFSRSVLQIIFRSSCVFQIGSSDHLRSSDTSIELESKKLEFHVDKFLHLSTKTQVSEARFCHRTWVSKTRDASFLYGFKTLLTNNILSPHSASLQIPSTNTNKYSIHFDWRIHLENWTYMPTSSNLATALTSTYRTATKHKIDICEKVEQNKLGTIMWLSLIMSFVSNEFIHLQQSNSLSHIKGIG